MRNRRTERSVNRKSAGGVYLLIGACLLAAALALVVNNLLLQKRAGEASGRIMAHLRETMPAPRETDGFDESGVEIYPDYVLNPDMPMPERTVEGERYVATVYFPQWERELPAASEFSYARLRSSPCRYAGSLYKNDMVLCAHNYSTHFGMLDKLLTGDSVLITDMDGNQFRFTVYYTEILEPGMKEQLLSGNWDLTLFTCTPGGENRVVVRCKLAEPERSARLADLEARQ